MHLKTLRILFYLTTTLWINSWADPTQNVYFSEFFANPTYTSDSEGEFLEVFNSGSEKNIVIVNNNTQTQILLKSNAFTLFCNENANFSCDFPLPFALANHKEYVLKIIFQNQIIDSTIVPAALDGISWQRNANLWEPTTFSFLSNRQTPGFGDLKTHPKQRFTQISRANFIQTSNSLVIEWQQTQDDTIVFTNLTKTSLTFVKNGLAKLQQTPLEGKKTNWNLWSYQFPQNDIPDSKNQILFFQNKPYLFISEINPFPSVNSTEWIEISNLGDESFPLDFSHLKIGSKKIDFPKNTYLPAQAKCILTSDSTKWLKSYAKVDCLLEINSFSLHNQGGEIIWIVGHDIINEIHWPSSTNDYRALTLQHYIEGDSLLTKWARPTLSYTGYRTPLKSQVILSSRLIKQNTPLFIKYKLTPQTLLKLTIYDRAGKEVWSKEENNIEYGEISWSGKDQNHRFLQPGLYLLHYQFNQNNPQSVSLVILPP